MASSAPTGAVMHQGAASCPALFASHTPPLIFRDTHGKALRNLHCAQPSLSLLFCPLSFFSPRPSSSRQSDDGRPRHAACSQHGSATTTARPTWPTDHYRSCGPQNKWRSQSWIPLSDFQSLTLFYHFYLEILISLSRPAFYPLPPFILDILVSASTSLPLFLFP